MKSKVTTPVLLVLLGLYLIPLWLLDLAMVSSGFFRERSRLFERLGMMLGSGGLALTDIGYLVGAVFAALLGNQAVKASATEDPSETNGLLLWGVIIVFGVAFLSSIGLSLFSTDIEQSYGSDVLAATSQWTKGAVGQLLAFVTLLLGIKYQESK